MLSMSMSEKTRLMLLIDAWPPAYTLIRGGLVCTSPAPSHLLGWARASSVTLLSAVSAPTRPSPSHLRVISFVGPRVGRRAREAARRVRFAWIASAVEAACQSVVISLLLAQVM